MNKITTVFLALTCSGIFAQKADFKKYYEEGSAFIDDANYLAALDAFMKAYKIDSANANINFQVGYCYLKHPTHKHLAERYLEKAVKNVSKNYNGTNPNEKHAPLQAYLWLGEAYHLDYKFEDAEKMMELYESKTNLGAKDKEEFKEVERLRKIVATARKQCTNPPKITIENLGDSINSEFPDFSPVLSADERVLIFSYRGAKGTGGNMTPDGQYFEDIFVSYKKYDGTWTEAKSIGAFVNTIGHEASVSVTPDGQTLILYKDDNGDGNLYYSQWAGGEWGSPVKFGDDINTKYWETHACYNTTKDILYFVSDRPGGYGGRDIYRSKKLPNGHWGKPVNLGPTINTAYDEDAPFLHTNGNDFYFASQDHGTMGGFDIFKSSIIMGTDSFTIPQALPFPINTTDDDVFFVLSPDNRRAYYASSHEDKNGHGEKDIYRIYMPNPEEPPLIVFLGQVLPAPCDELPTNLEIQVTDLESKEMVGVYRPQQGTGSFTLILFPDKTYHFSYLINDKEIYRDTVVTVSKEVYQEIKREVQLKAIILDPTNNQQLPCILGKLKVRVFDNNVSKTPINNSEVTITDRIGRKIKAYTNAKGELEIISIKTNDEFNIGAKSGKQYSPTTRFNTKGYNQDTLISLDIFMEERIEVTSNEAKSIVPGNYKCYFKYNENQAECDEMVYTAFIEKLKAYILVKGKVDLRILSSASNVPTKTFRSNEKLAITRNEKTKEKIISSLEKLGIDRNKILFSDSKSVVAGPAYKNDYEENKAEYEKFQFVEVSVIVK